MKLDLYQGVQFSVLILTTGQRGFHFSPRAHFAVESAAAAQRRSRSKLGQMTVVVIP